MQDKEFDKLFKEKLEDILVSPVAETWAKIDSGLNNQRRFNFSAVSKIAAVVIVVLAIGIYFNRLPIKPENIHAGIKRPLLKSTLAVTEYHETDRPEQRHKYADDRVKKAVVHDQEIKISLSGTKKIANEKRNDFKTVAELPQPIAKATTTSADQRNETLLTVVPDSGTKLATVVAFDQSVQSPFKTNNVQSVLDLNTGKQQDPPANRFPSKHRIHNLGDIINVVVAQIDKRPDKVIEFTDTDDDQSNITGVNLGILKIKKSK